MGSLRQCSDTVTFWIHLWEARLSAPCLICHRSSPHSGPLCLPLPCAGRWKQSLILCDRNEPLRWYPLIPERLHSEARFVTNPFARLHATWQGLVFFTSYLPENGTEWVLLKGDGGTRRRTRASSFVCFQGQGLSRGTKTKWESNLGGVKLLQRVYPWLEMLTV